MAKVPLSPPGGRAPSHTGRMVVKSWRGKLVAQSWPRKRTKAEREAVREQNEWFKQANWLAKYADPAQWRIAYKMAEGTPLYPRDILISAMAGREFGPLYVDGKWMFPMAAVNDVSFTLDVIAQQVGSILVRTPDGWRGLPPGEPGQVLVSQGPDLPPTWKTVTETGAILDAPDDGNMYARQNAEWAQFEPGGGEAETGHKAWRVRATQAGVDQDPNAYVYQLEFRQTPGLDEPHQDEPHKISAGFTNPERAFTASTSLSTFASTTSLQNTDFLGIVFAEPHDAKELFINSRYSTRFLRSFVVESSPDGAEWTERLRVLDNPVGAQTYAIPAL